MKKEIGLRLKQSRQMKHLTQEELAELTDFSVSQIRRLETGRTPPSLEVLCLLCDKLDVGLEYLLSDFLSESNAEQNTTMHQILDTLNHMDAEDQKFILDYILLYQSHLQDIKEGSQH